MLAGYTESPNGTDSRWPEMEQWIVCAARKGAQDFWHLVDMLPGAFPTDVRQTLDGLVARSVVPEHLTIESARRQRDCGTELEVSDLPAPHPLAFDWRFTKATAVGLLEKATTLSLPDGLIGMLGAPSVYFLARKHGNGDRVTYSTRILYWWTVYPKSIPVVRFTVATSDASPRYLTCSV